MFMSFQEQQVLGQEPSRRAKTSSCFFARIVPHTHHPRNPYYPRLFHRLLSYKLVWVVLGIRHLGLPEGKTEVGEGAGFSLSPSENLWILQNPDLKFRQEAPAISSSQPRKTLLPKLEFFRSIGLSSPDLARIISSDPTLLTRSLRKQILPSYVHLKSVFLSDEKIVAVLKRTTWIFAGDQTKSLIPNIAFLREQEVPERCISLLLNNFPTVLMQRNEDFVRVVGEVKEMGFEPNKSTFVVAVHAMSGKGSKTLRERSFQVYRRWGWSKDDILRAFRKHPNCMLFSEDKIMKNMDFFVNGMGYSARMISHNPIVLFFSLEKRIIPRFSVIRVLASKGLMKRDLTLQTVLQPNEMRFLKRFVLKYEGLAPELLSVYYGKLKLVKGASAES